MLRDLKDGLFSYLDAFSIASQYKLWKYTFWAGIVCLLIAVIAVFGAWSYSDNIASLILGWLDFLPTSGFLATVTEWVSGILLFLLFFVVYKYIILIVMAPFMSPLSEELENKLNEDYEPIPFSFTLILKDLWRGLRINIRNLLRELFYTIILFLLSFIPAVGLITAPLLLIVQSYYAGFGNMDYYLERHYNVSESSSFVKGYKGLAIGNGAIFLLILMIPIVGVFLAPTLATIAATQECERRMAA